MGCGESLGQDIVAPVGGNEEGVDVQLLVDDGLSNPVEIHVSCQGLADLDVTSKSDPMAVLYQQNSAKMTWEILGRTEMIMNNLSPVFVQSIVVKYRFEERQRMHIDLYDIDDMKNLTNFASQDFIGSAEFVLSEAIHAPNHIWKAELQRPTRKKNGTVTLRLEELSKKMSGDLVKLVVEGNLSKQRRNFFRLVRMAPTGPVPVYQSESAVFVQNVARWRPVSVGAAGLMRDDPAHPLAMELYEYRANGSHVLLGTDKFSFSELVKQPRVWKADFGIMAAVLMMYRKRDGEGRGTGEAAHVSGVLI